VHVSLRVEADNLCAEYKIAVSQITGDDLRRELVTFPCSGQVTDLAVSA
jgi:hypothetical protein